MNKLEGVIAGLSKASELIEQWIPMFAQYNTPATIDESIELLKEYEDALRSMVYQYCTIRKGVLFGEKYENPDKEIFFHSFMCAGEQAFKVLGIDNAQEVPEDWLRL